MNGTNQSTANNLWRLWNLANNLGLRNFRFNSSNFGRTLNLRLENGEEFSTESFEEARKFLCSKK